MWNVNVLFHCLTGQTNAEREYLLESDIRLKCRLNKETHLTANSCALSQRPAIGSDTKSPIIPHVRQKGPNPRYDIHTYLRDPTKELSVTKRSLDATLATRYADCKKRLAERMDWQLIKFIKFFGYKTPKQTLNLLAISCTFHRNPRKALHR